MSVELFVQRLRVAAFVGAGLNLRWAVNVVRERAGGHIAYALLSICTTIWLGSRRSPRTMRRSRSWVNEHRGWLDAAWLVHSDNNRRRDIWEDDTMSVSPGQRLFRSSSH
jgi:hypothetical protein